MLTVWEWGEKEKNQGRPQDFGLSTLKYVLPSTKMSKAVDGVGFGVEYQEFSFGHVDFEMPVRL